MKKIIMLLSVIGVFSLQGCTGPEGMPGQDGLLGEVFELKNINFAFNTTDGFNIYQSLTPNIFPADVLLIYRMTGTINSTTPIWESIPKTLFLTSGREFDYSFDFSRQDFTIFASGNYDISTTPEYLNNQTFRIVIVPGAFAKSLDTSNYASVMAALNLKESQVQKINF
jgi:hypothetical protein